LRLLVWSFEEEIVLAMFGCIWISRIVSSRLAKVNVLGRNVMEGDLTLRLEVGTSGDQFD